MFGVYEREKKRDMEGIGLSGKEVRNGEEQDFFWFFLNLFILFIKILTTLFN